MPHIILHQGNRLEEMASLLGDLVIANRSRRFSLEPVVVLVNNFEMAQWLSIRMAEQDSVCANVHFKLLGSFAWDLAQECFGSRDNDTVTKERLKWIVLKQLLALREGIISGDDMSGLMEYISGCSSSDLYPLASSIADTFDRYLNYRYDLLQAWERGDEAPHHGWQAALWRMLASDAGGRFRVQHLFKLADHLEKGASDISLPEQLYIFGVSYIPPLHLQLLSAMSRVVDIHLFIMNPCREYWMDIIDKKERARFRKTVDPETLDNLFPSLNPILASMGKAGRSFLSRIYALDFMDGEERFVSNSESAGHGPVSILHAVQDSVLGLEPAGSARHGLLLEDESLIINSCYSPLREVEALHDYLVHLFEHHPDLTPGDVLVMAPAIQNYASLVDAVFGAAPDEHRIPYSIADQPLYQHDQAADAFLKIFLFPLTDFTASDVVDLMSQPIMMERMDLDQADLSDIRELVRVSGIRRGLETLSPRTDVTQNTWTFGLDRLMASHAIASEPDKTFSSLGIAPFELSVEAGQTARVAALSSFVFNLHDFARLAKDKKRCSPEEWRSIFEQLMLFFISPNPAGDQRCASLMDRLDGIIFSMESAGIPGLSYSEMLPVIQGILGSEMPPRAFITGKVIFSSLVPMRTIPFKVICILGMNDQDFPRKTVFPAFDLMARDFRPGDRVPRDEDRYLFLETLLSARERLWISYVGRSECDDSVQNPSVLVSELLSYVNDFVRASLAREDSDLSVPIVLREHPLQPFSRRYFSGRGPGSLLTYAREWSIVDDKGQLLPRQDVQPLCPEALPMEESGDFSIQVGASDFQWFFANPVKHFLKNRLGIDLQIGEEVLQDTEPNVIERGAAELVQKRFMSLERKQISKPTDEDVLEFFRPCLETARARGLVPPGIIADFAWDGYLLKGLNLPKLIRALNKKGHGVQDMDANISIEADGGVTAEITGRLGRLTSRGEMLEYRMKKVYAREWAALWVRHLLFTACASVDISEPVSSVINPGTAVNFDALSRDAAMLCLSNLVRMYFLGHEQPLLLVHFISSKLAKILNDYGIYSMDDIQRAEATDPKCLYSLSSKLVSELKKQNFWSQKHGGKGLMDDWLGFAFRYSHEHEFLERVVSNREFIRHCLDFYSCASRTASSSANSGGE